MLIVGRFIMGVDGGEAPPQLGRKTVTPPGLSGVERGAWGWDRLGGDQDSRTPPKVGWPEVLNPPLHSARALDLRKPG